jgi:hypothetical protein
MASEISHETPAGSRNMQPFSTVASDSGIHAETSSDSGALSLIWSR